MNRDAMRTSRPIDLISEFVSGGLVLPFDPDCMHDFLQATPIIQQRYCQKEEAEAVDAADHSVER